MKNKNGNKWRQHKKEQETLRLERILEKKKKYNKKTEDRNNKNKDNKLRIFQNIKKNTKQQKM